MNTIRIRDCEVYVLSIVNGIQSEADRVHECFGDHEAYGAALGIEGIQAIKNRVQLNDEFEVSELDLAYAHRMEQLTGLTVEMPSPAICALVDECAKRNMNVIALDMNDSDFTEMYCETVKTWDFVKEHRLAKKGMKKRFNASTPEEFALQWDAYVNSVKGYRDVSLKRERYIAEQIADVAKYRSDFMVVVEVERASGIMKILEAMK